MDCSERESLHFISVAKFSGHFGRWRRDPSGKGASRGWVPATVGEAKTTPMNDDRRGSGETISKSLDQLALLLALKTFDHLLPDLFEGQRLDSLLEFEEVIPKVRLDDIADRADLESHDRLFERGRDLLGFVVDQSTLSRRWRIGVLPREDWKVVWTGNRLSLETSCLGLFFDPDLADIESIPGRILIAIGLIVGLDLFFGHRNFFGELRLREFQFEKIIENFCAPLAALQNSGVLVSPFGRRLFVLRLEVLPDIFLGEFKVGVERLTDDQLAQNEPVEEAAALLVLVERTARKIGEPSLDEAIEGRGMERLSIDLDNDGSGVVLGRILAESLAARRAHPSQEPDKGEEGER